MDVAGDTFPAPFFPSLASSSPLSTIFLTDLGATNFAAPLSSGAAFFSRCSSVLNTLTSSSTFLLHRSSVLFVVVVIVVVVSVVFVACFVFTFLRFSAMSRNLSLDSGSDLVDSGSALLRVFLGSSLPSPDDGGWPCFLGNDRCLNIFKPTSEASSADFGSDRFVWMRRNVSRWDLVCSRFVVASVVPGNPPFGPPYPAALGLHVTGTTFLALGISRLTNQ